MVIEIHQNKKKGIITPFSFNQKFIFAKSFFITKILTTFVILICILSITANINYQNDLISNNINKFDEVNNMKKDIRTNDFVLNNSIQGRTNLRFKATSPPWYTWLDANEPFSYRTGTIQLISYLGWISKFGVCSRTDDIDFNRINTTFNEVKKIFTTSRINDARLWTFCNALIILKILDRLDEVDNAPMITYIQNQQLEDGGFHAHSSYTNPSGGNYSSVLMTYFSVLALDLVGEKPLNCTAVRDFVYRMQVNETLGPYFAWEFKKDPTTFASDIFSTNYALNVLPILGYEIPNKENLTKKIEATYQNIVANFSSWSNTEKRS